MKLKFITKDINPVLEYLFKNIQISTADKLVEWLKLTAQLCTDTNRLSVSTETNGSVAFCRDHKPLAIWH